MGWPHRQRPCRVHPKRQAGGVRVLVAERAWIPGVHRKGRVSGSRLSGDVRLVQLVRSTDNESSGEQFEIDPFALFGDAPSPYCWFGIELTLFDAPSRPEILPSEWVAHSFLGTTPMAEVMDGNPRRVVPVLGLSLSRWPRRSTASAAASRVVAGLSARRSQCVSGRSWCAGGRAPGSSGGVISCH